VVGGFDLDFLLNAESTAIKPPKLLPSYCFQAVKAAITCKNCISKVIKNIYYLIL
jgi:hypothetical protein